MSFEVRTEFGNLDPEAKRALVAMQHAIKGHLDEQQKRNSRPKRPVTELVEEGSVLAKPGQVVRVQPSDEDIEVVLPPSDPGNGGEDIIVSFEGDGTATGKVVVTPMSGTCANPGTTTLNTPGSYRFTSTGAPSEGEFAEESNWSGPAPVALEDLPEIAPQRLLGNNTVATASPTELTASQVLDWVDSTRGTVPYRGAAAWAGLDPGAIELPIVSKGAGADPVYQQLATAGIADDAVTNAKLANMAQSTVKLRAAGAGTGDPTDGTVTQVLDMVGSTRGSLLERGASAWNAITPGTSGLPLVSAGAGADPAYTALANAGLATMAQGTIKGRAAGAGTGVVTDLTGAQVGDILETEALVWTAVEQFNGELRLGTLHTQASVSGALNITLTAGATRVFITSTADVTLGTISGCADGRLLVVEYARVSGSGNLIVSHDSTTANAIGCPGDTKLIIAGRGGFTLVGRLGTNNNWKVVGVANPDARDGNVNLTSLSGAQGVINIADLPCGGSVTVQTVSAAYSIAGFTAKVDGYWFDLIDRRTSGTTVGTLLEDSGATTTSLRNPEVEEVYFPAGGQARLYYFNSRWRVRTSLSVRGRLIKVTKYTGSSGTHTYDTRARTADVELVGQGGGGGGAGNAQEFGGGGAGGAYHRLYITTLPTSSAYNVGDSAGVGGSGTGSVAGTAGEDTTFVVAAETYRAEGGSGGQGGGVSTPGEGIRPTALTYTTINSAGSNGGWGSYVNAGAVSVFGGAGGDGPWGGGGINNENATGEPGNGPGAGGSGGSSFSGTDRQGGDGDDGLIIVSEYT